MNIAFRSWLYDFLYIVADQLIKIYNPCQIHKDATGEVRCANRSYGPCCDSCRFLGPNGCTTKCLLCKLWLCWATENGHMRLCRVFSKMRTIAYKYNLRGVQMSKKEVFDNIRETERLRLERTVYNYGNNKINK